MASCPPKNAAGGVQLPQDIIETIVDEVADPLAVLVTGLVLSVGHLATALEQVGPTLKACALAGRYFMHASQRHVFSVALLSRSRLTVRFAELIGDHPHLANYVRHIYITYTTAAADSDTVCRILSSLPHLLGVGAFATASRELENATPQVMPAPWEDHSLPLKTAFRTALGRPDVRQVEWRRVSFADLGELHSMLLECPSLKALKLVRCAESTIPDSSAAPERIGIRILDSLHLERMSPLFVDHMLDSFVGVDIRHLKSLTIRSTPGVTKLLRANRSTLREIKLAASDTQDTESVDRDILAGQNVLQSVHISLDHERRPGRDNSTLKRTIDLCGNLRNLKALRTFTLQGISADFGDQYLLELDAALGTIQTLERIEIGLRRFPDSDEWRNGPKARVRQLLPFAHRKGKLFIE
ncbi:hypothetical protein C8R46DRAFT_1136654 [Mycena filopes]|nr:hypothetical protein C8R46DRAFT_1136654 [Mycena filopes]